MMEEDDRNNISNHSLFKKHDACHSCTFAKALSKFQRRLPMIKWQPLASELRYLVHGHGKPKATMPSVKIAKRGLCWEQWGLALTKPGCVFDVEAKTRSSFPSGEWTRQDECVRDVDRLNRVRTFFHRKERSFTKKSRGDWKLFNSIIIWK